jgi:hypothetical protein
VGVDLTQVNDFDLVEWHKQTGEIVARRMIQSSVNVRKLQNVVVKLSQQLSNEKTINRIKENKVRELEGQIASITDGNKETTNFKAILDEKEKEIRSLKARLKIPHFQLTESKELIEAYQAKDKVSSENVTLKENVTTLNKEIVELKLEKESLSKKVSGEVNKGSQVHDSLLMSPMVISSSATGPPENNQQKGKHITELEEQLERKTQKINILIKEKESLSKLLEDTLEQTVGTQHLVEARQILWDQIIQVMDNSGPTWKYISYVKQ